MNIFDQLAREEEKLKGIGKERDTNLTRLTKELADLKERGAPKETLQKMTSEFEARKELYDGIFEKIESTVNDLREQVISQKMGQVNQAKAELEDMRAKAETSWINQGGELSEFETAWPEMKADILKQKTMDDLFPKDTDKPIWKRTTL